MASEFLADSQDDWQSVSTLADTVQDEEEERREREREVRRQYVERERSRRRVPRSNMSPWEEARAREEAADQEREIRKLIGSSDDWRPGGIWYLAMEAVGVQAAYRLEWVWNRAQDIAALRATEGLPRDFRDLFALKITHRTWRLLGWQVVFAADRHTVLRWERATSWRAAKLTTLEVMQGDGEWKQHCRALMDNIVQWQRQEEADSSAEQHLFDPGVSAGSAPREA